ncbi:methyltransferase domain-containing protein [Azospirillum sp. TSO22-1]|uniref:methyltransferase domain-containing protein n=1 Tax=Azospirillum sp. TSO22-1 TaxID=716789 RepID=UPI000D622BBA|nr:methyltransferase domain-containing protein [Azospirillum sp. TSO22-1]PWC54603.1 phosphoethanolamine methyltransferase [Azospirillum sp. TSO22-1]
MTDKTEPGDAPHLKLKTRLHAWWEGYDLAGLKRRKGEDPAESAPAATAKPAGKPPEAGQNRWGKPLWNATRIEVAERLWGKGFSTPGGTEHISYLVKPMGLNPAMSALDLSAGLGGASRTMAQQFGCWVTGLEASPLLAKAGMERSHMAGLDKRAPIEGYDPERFSFPKRVDGIVYKEGLFTVRDKDQMFDGIEASLKPRGHLLITDYILGPKPNRGLVAAWAEHEPLEPNLWSLEQMQNAFAQRNLDLRIAEDITDTHRHLILTALQGFTQVLEQYSLAHDTKVAVMDEIELWARRVSALDNGLRCYRFYALKPAE